MVSSLAVLSLFFIKKVVHLLPVLLNNHAFIVELLNTGPALKNNKK